MPIIELGDAFPRDRLLAIMLFPKDDGMRRAYAAHQRVIALDKLGAAQVDAALARELAYSLSYTQMRAATAESFRCAHIVGTQMLLLYVMHCDRPSRASERAARMATQNLLKAKKFGDGSPRSRSSKSLRDYWDKYRDVAHLWAAFSLHRQFLRCMGSDPSTLLESAAFRSTFLGTAKTLESFGMQYKAPLNKRKHALLDADALWRVPVGIRANFPPLAELSVELRNVLPAGKRDRAT